MGGAIFVENGPRSRVSNDRKKSHSLSNRLFTDRENITVRKDHKGHNGKGARSQERGTFGRCHGLVRLPDQQQPDKMINYKLQAAPTALSKGQNSQRQGEANRIDIGVDAHLKSYQAARKIDNGAVGVAQTFRSKEGLLL